MIVVNIGGVTHRHEKEVEVGEIWEGIYPFKEAVYITAVYDRQLEYYYMSNPLKTKQDHKVNFYTFFRRVQ